MRMQLVLCLFVIVSCQSTKKRSASNVPPVEIVPPQPSDPQQPGQQQVIEPQHIGSCVLKHDSLGKVMECREYRSTTASLAAPDLTTYWRNQCAIYRGNPSGSWSDKRCTELVDVPSCRESKVDHNQKGSSTVWVYPYLSPNCGNSSGTGDEDTAMQPPPNPTPIPTTVPEPSTEPASIKIFETVNVFHRAGQVILVRDFVDAPGWFHNSFPPRTELPIILDIDIPFDFFNANGEGCLLRVQQPGATPKHLINLRRDTTLDQRVAHFEHFVAFSNLFPPILGLDENVRFEVACEGLRGTKTTALEAVYMQRSNLSQVWQSGLIYSPSEKTLVRMPSLIKIFESNTDTSEWGKASYSGMPQLPATPADFSSTWTVKMPSKSPFPNVNPSTFALKSECAVHTASRTADGRVTYENRGLVDTTDGSKTVNITNVKADMDVYGRCRVYSTINAYEEYYFLKYLYRVTATP